MEVARSASRVLWQDMHSTRHSMQATLTQTRSPARGSQPDARGVRLRRKAYTRASTRRYYSSPVLYSSKVVYDRKILEK
jgi:hypothetical protein